MTELAKKCIDVVLQNEGGYVNNRYDAGGETNYGISKRNHPDEDIKNLTRERAAQIYYDRYWLPMNLEGIKDPDLVLQVFDMGVNAGGGMAIKLLQRIVMVEADGDCGPITTKAVNEYQGNLADVYRQERKKFYFAIARRENNHVFLAGWLNRVDKTKFE